MYLHNPSALRVLLCKLADKRASVYPCRLGINLFACRRSAENNVCRRFRLRSRNGTVKEDRIVHTVVRRAATENVKIFDSLFENVAKGCKILYLRAGAFGKLLYIRSEFRSFDIHRLVRTEGGENGNIKISVLSNGYMISKAFGRVVCRAYELDV